MKERRLAEIDVAATIGILLIVFGHAFVTAAYDQANPAWYRTTKDFVYGFHIHCFFLLSGFLLGQTHSNGFDSVRFLKNRAVRLLIPYLVYTILNVAVCAMIPSLTNYPVNNLADLGHVISHPRDNVIRFHWFLVVLMTFALSAPLILLALRHALGALALVSIALWLHFDFFKHMQPLLVWSFSRYFWIYFCLGAVLQRYGSTLPFNCFKRCPMAWGGLAFVLALICFQSDSRLAAFGHALTGSLMIVSLSCAYVRSHCSFLSWAMGLNLTILLLSWYGHRFADGLFDRVLGLGFAVVMPVSMALGILVPMLAVRLLAGRHPWIDVLIGQSGYTPKSVLVNKTSKV